MSEPEILIAAGCSHVTVTRYRCAHLQEQLAVNGVQAVVEEWYDFENIDPNHELPAKALVLQRVPITPALETIIERMHRADKPVIYDVDDLVFEPRLTAWHRGVANLTPSEQTLYTDGVRRYAAALGCCDYALVASPLLAKLAQQHGPTAFVHRNALGSEMSAHADALYAMRRARPAGDRVVLGYGSGTPTHDMDFAEAVPGLADVLTRYSNAELWIAGPMQLPPELARFNARIRRFPLLSWRAWFELASQMDIALAPLEMGNLFCRAKSEIKFVEAGALGLPVVASRIDPFEAVIVHGENGFLAGNAAAWMEALDALVGDAALRRHIGESARRTVEVHYSHAARAVDLASLLPTLLAAPAAAITQPAAELATRTMEIMDNHRQSESAMAIEITSELRTASSTDGAPSMEPAPAVSSPAPFTPLTINWLVTEPFPGSGGHTGIFRMIRHLVEFGHVCYVYTIPVHFMQKYTPAQIQKYVSEHFMPTGAVFHQWSEQTGPADATIATYWQTVPLLQRLPVTGRRYYLVQDFEPYFYPVGSEYIQAENTYRQGLHCITLGPWLAKLMREQYGAAADHFDFAVDPEIYWPVPEPRELHPRIAFYARPSTPRRAYELGLEALKLVKERRPEVEIIFYGADKLAPRPDFPVHNMGILNPWELAKLFSTCDIGLVFSTTDPSFVPFEMMACRCAVVDIRSERVAGLLEDGVNCRLAEPTPDSIATTVLDFLWHKDQRAAIVERSYAQVKQMSWRRSPRQIEEILLRHAPPPTERVAFQEASSDDIDMLAWQIHQLLDAEGNQSAVVDELRSALYRTLAEKAALVQHVQQVEQSYDTRQRSARGNRVRAAVQPLTDKALDGVPAWLLGGALLSKLALNAMPYQQTFRADRSHLCRIELRFAPYYPVHTGAIHFTLYDGDANGRPVTTELIRVADIAFDAPYVIDFPVEIDAYNRDYTFTITAAEVSQHSPALWHFWQVQHADARLTRGGQPLAGELAFQPYFRERVAYLPPRLGAAAWDEPIRLAPTFARDLVSKRGREVVRLAGKVRATLREQGVGGLVQQVSNYIDWQLGKSKNER